MMAWVMRYKNSCFLMIVLCSLFASCSFGGDLESLRPQVEKSYTITFVSNNGSAVESETVNSGIKVTRPADPYLEGYIFENWYIDPDLTVVYDFSTPVSGNITLYAKWTDIPEGSFAVYFNSNGGSNIPGQIVAYGQKIEQPENPTKLGKAFIGWFTDSGLTNSWNFASGVVTQNVTLNANWADATGKYLVRFVANGGNPVPHDQVVSPGGKASEPALTMDNATFGGWYDGSMKTPWLFGENTVNTPIVLYAKWNDDGYYTVNFCANGGNPAWSNVEVAYGSTVNPAQINITRTGYNAVWYKDVGLTTLWDFSTSITTNTTLFARWIPDSSITLSFAQITDAAPSITGPVIYLAGGTGRPVSATITVGSPSQYDAGSIKWYYNNTPIALGSISGTYGETMTINSANYNGVGLYAITVEVKKGGLLYTRIVNFEIKP